VIIGNAVKLQHQIQIPERNTGFLVAQIGCDLVDGKVGMQHFRLFVSEAFVQNGSAELRERGGLSRSVVVRLIVSAKVLRK